MNGTSPTNTVCPLPDTAVAVPENLACHDVGERPLHVLQIAFVCHPEQSMETRIGWRRAIQAAKRHNVTVLHGRAADNELLTAEASRLGLAERLRFVPVERCLLGSMLNRSSTTYYLGYRLWHKCALKTARRLQQEQRFDLVHQTTYCGFREPGDGWRLGVPFVWGPVGGTQAFPTAYLRQLSLQSAWIEVCRNVINAWQLRLSGRVRRASRRAAVLIAATEKASGDLHRLSRRRVPVKLETALDRPVTPARAPRSAGESFNILWAGRLRAWKTMPLLLKALPLLPPDVPWRLRVLGVGNCENRWKRLAEQLGIADRIEWLGWPEYRQTLPHYRWADAFAFTSMRDTSGTGLLEALAAGTPIVGVNHQGAADIMTNNCAVPVPVGRPIDTINGFAMGLTRLARDPSEWHRLSEGARARAVHLHWDEQTDALLGWYATAMQDSAATAHGVSRGHSAAPIDAFTLRIHSPPAPQPTIG